MKFIKHKIAFIGALILLIGLSSCTKIGMYSVVLKSSVQFKQEELNELKDKEKLYHHKKVVFPSSITVMSEKTKKAKLERMQQYTVHTLDTTVKMSTGNLPAQISLNTACQQGIATVYHEHSNLKKNGKQLDVKISYTCVEDSVGVNWAADNTYIIEPIGREACSSGFHSVEFMLYNSTVMEDKLAPELSRFLFVCGEK